MTDSPVTAAFSCSFITCAMRVVMSFKLHAEPGAIAGAAAPRTVARLMSTAWLPSTVAVKFGVLVSSASNSVLNPAIGVVVKTRLWLKPPKLLPITVRSLAPPALASSCNSSLISAEPCVTAFGANIGDAGSIVRPKNVSRPTSWPPSSWITTRLNVSSGFGVA